MPARDIRTLISTIRPNGKWSTAGHYQVYYKTPGNPRLYIARVLGAGTTSGLRLKVKISGTITIIDNVPAATSAKQTGAYFIRF